VVGLTHTLRAEAADLGVRVSLVCPGKIETPIYETSRIIGFDRDKVLSLWPKGVTPEECARVILEGVAENRATIVVTRLAKAMWWLQRISPPTMIWAARRYMKKMRAFRQSTNQNDAPVSTQ
jgi:short-subunit dehydrogenase